MNSPYKMTGQQAEERMQLYREIFTVVRLLDAGDLRLSGSNEDKEYQTGKMEHCSCYEYWEKNEPCENCISRKVYQDRKQRTKLEYKGNELFEVTACFVEVDGKPCVMELVRHMDGELLIDAEGREKLLNRLTGYHDELYIDALTGAYNRRYYEDKIKTSVQKGGIAMIDLDDFKLYNDTCGHDAGDAVLKTIVLMIRSCIRDADSLIRYGGDEFLLFLPDVTAESVSDTMAQLFKQFHAIAQADTEIRYASLSAGLCLCTIGDTFADCYAKADKALYFVKQNGKNQFSFYQQINYQAPGSASIARDLRQIADSLRQSGSYAGALDLNYRDFSRQYEYMNQLIIRSSCRCYLVMVTMETAADTLPHIEEIEQALSQMEQSIRQTIRRVDVCTRYSAMQYLIILFEPIETQIPNIMDRIFIQYYKHSKSHSFQPGYEYLTMTEMKENDDK